VASDAQYGTIAAKGMTTGSDQFTVKVLSGGSYATETTVYTSIGAADSWTTLRFNLVSWQGQSIKLKVTRTVGSIAIDDLALQTIDVPRLDARLHRDGE